jgi:GNAT superfamily N-acetyltransferase
LKPLDEVSSARMQSGIEVADLDATQMPGIRELNRRRGNPAADRYFENSLAQGIRGFVALKDGQTVGYYHWVDGRGGLGHPDIWYMGKDFALAPDDVYGSGLYLEEEHRGGSAASDFLFGVESALRDQGYKRLWGYVVSGNRPARWLYVSRGYEPTWKMRSRRFLFYRRRERLRE